MHRTGPPPAGLPSGRPARRPVPAVLAATLLGLQVLGIVAFLVLDDPNGFGAL